MIIRPALPTDAAEMCALLNDIIAIGGSTAHLTPFDTDRMQQHYIAPDDLICCHVAELDDQVIGFQWLGWPDDTLDLPNGWAIIASFVATDAAGKGVGRRLFAAPVTEAESAGVKTIDATIRTDNWSGLKYYSSIGFTDYNQLSEVALSDGTLVNKVQKRFEIG